MDLEKQCGQKITDLFSKVIFIFIHDNTSFLGGQENYPYFHNRKEKVSIHNNATESKFIQGENTICPNCMGYNTTIEMVQLTGTTKKYSIGLEVRGIVSISTLRISNLFWKKATKRHHLKIEKFVSAKIVGIVGV